MTTKPLAGKLIAITGTLSVSRDEFVALLEAAGATITNSLTRATDFLVAGANPGSKFDKAEAMLIPIWTEDMARQAMKPLYGTIRQAQKVYGASDDLVELTGPVREKFYTVDDTYHLRFSNGTCVKVTLTSEGVWRVEILKRGTGSHRRLIGLPDSAETEGSPQLHGDPDAPSYSDVVIIETDEPLTLEDHGSTPLKEPTPALRKAKKVIALLEDRGGFDSWWQDIDEEDREDIVDALATLLEEKP